MPEVERWRQMPHQEFDRWIAALIALKAAYMRERNPKRSCQIYITGYRLAMRLLINSKDNSCMGLRGFFSDHERSDTCHYLLKLWRGEDPWHFSRPQSGGAPDAPS